MRTNRINRRRESLPNIEASDVVERSMTWRFTLALGVLFLLASIPIPGHTGQAYVEVGPAALNPKVLYLDPGDTIMFAWGGGTHHISAYRDGSFDSGAQESPFLWEIPFAGNTIKYRCVLHSSVNAVGQCSGMCGILTDDATLDVQPPGGSITKPRRNEAVVVAPSVDPTTAAVRFPVRIEGTAYDDKALGGVAIRWYDNAGRPLETPANCPACGSTFSTWDVEISLLPGTYLVEAGIADVSGNRFLTPRTSFIVV
jgi:plastocyanin